MFYYVGRVLGWIVFLLIILPMRVYYNRKGGKYIGLEKLEALKGKSFFLAANHIKPRSKFLKWISIPYDAFVARRMLLEVGIYATAITSYDSLHRPKNKLARFFVEHVKEQLNKGIIVSLDLIPINRKASDQVTFQDLKKRLQEKPAAIGIFPEGTWFRGFRKNRKMFNGVAILSKRYNLPVVPVYIDAYNMNKEITILVGDILEGKETKQVCDKIRELYEIHKKGVQYV